ncbi:MAG: hypothetical protein ACRERC_14390 [Candidatus Binatia bacterium]
MEYAVGWLNLLFGRGDDDHPYWLLAVRLNVLLFLACAALVLAWHLRPRRLRAAPDRLGEIAVLLGLTGLAAWLRWGIASANLLDLGGIPYSRLLLGYQGYFGSAQLYSPWYELTARQIEQGIRLNRLAGTLTVPLVYLTCRALAPRQPLLAALAALLIAVSPLHILFSASDALAIASGFLAAASYALLAGGAARRQHPRATRLHWLGGFAGLALLTQVRYENLLFLLPVAAWLLARRRALAWPALRTALAPAALLVAAYAVAAAGASVSYRARFDVARGLDLLLHHLVLNPFTAIPLLLAGTLAIGVYRGLARGALALLPWVMAGGLVVLTTDSGHSAARIFANWLVVLLPLAAWGFALMLGGRRPARRLAAVALLVLAVQPWLLRAQLGARHLEMAEHEWFTGLLAALPPGTAALVVPDDELLRRQAGSTLEVMHKYAMIRAAQPGAAALPRLIGITEYLEHPERSGCAPGTCLFVGGLPCLEQEVYPFTHVQCAALLRQRRTTALDALDVVAAPFVPCAVYAGAAWQDFCAPATEARRLALYRLDD